MKELPAKLGLPALLLISISIFLGLIGCPAGPRIEKRDEATHVFTGKVKALHEDKGDGVVFYDVEIAVESVEKGEGVKPGDSLTVNCYVTYPSPELKKKERKDKFLKIRPSNGSYSGVPKENARVKVYTRKEKETYRGIYPDWYDVMESN